MSRGEFQLRMGLTRAVIGSINARLGLWACVCAFCVYSALGLIAHQNAPAEGVVVPVLALERAVDEESQHAGSALFRGFSGFHSGVVLLSVKGDLTPRLVPRCISVIRC